MSEREPQNHSFEPEKEIGPDTEQEQNPEKQEQIREIIEKAQDSRLKLLERVVSSISNFVPGLGATKMVSEAWRGKTIDGKKLTALGRLNHLLIQGINGYAYFSLGRGHVFKAATLHSIGTGLSIAQYAPETIRDLSAFFVKKGQDKVADQLGILKNVIEKSSYRKLFFESNGNDI